MRYVVIASLALVLLGALLAALWPQLDLQTAALFFDPAYIPADPNNRGFYWRELWAPNALHEAIQTGSRILAAALVIAAIIKWHRKAALFLLLALLLGPGLLTNTVLKDNWGRARPVQVQDFGGTASFTPALQITNQCQRNCSFVSGDGSLGFFLHSFFYVVPPHWRPHWRRRVFLLGFVGGGAVFGGLRVAMGAHFLSDVLWGGLLMLLTSALVHALCFGRAQTAACWRSLFDDAKPKSAAY